MSRRASPTSPIPLDEMKLQVIEKTQVPPPGARGTYNPAYTQILEKAAAMELNKALRVECTNHQKAVSVKQSLRNRLKREKQHPPIAVQVQDNVVYVFRIEIENVEVQ